MRLKWVVLECPYRQWHRKEVREWFGKYVQMKKEGFEKEYPSGVIPFGTYDWVANVLLIVNEETGEPVCVFKSIDQTQSAQFHLEDELSSILRKSGDAQHLQAIQDVMHSANQRNVKVGYNSSWTIHPDARVNPELKKAAREMSVALFYHYYTQFGIEEILTGGSVRFKVPELMKFMGFDDLKLGAEALGPIHSPFLFGETTQLLHAKSFSEYARNLASAYQAHWDEREEYRLEDAEQTNPAAAKKSAA